MIKIGTDIAEISRFKEMKDISLFEKRAFTKREIEYFSTLKNPYQSIAGSFAAKEAFAKFMGSGFRGFGQHDIEVMHDELCKPYLCFMGRRLETATLIHRQPPLCAERVFTLAVKMQKCSKATVLYFPKEKRI